MPYATPKNCAAPACAKASIYGKRYCADHTKVKNSQDYERYRVGDVGQKLYKTKEWAVTRRYHLAANPFCVDCLARVIKTAQDLHVDHIIPLKDYEGDPLDPSNLATRCRSCHTVKSNKERRGK